MAPHGRRQRQASAPSTSKSPNDQGQGGARTGSKASQHSPGFMTRVPSSTAAGCTARPGRTREAACLQPGTPARVHLFGLPGTNFIPHTSRHDQSTPPNSTAALQASIAPSRPSPALSPGLRTAPRSRAPHKAVAGHGKRIFPSTVCASPDHQPQLARQHTLARGRSVQLSLRPAHFAPPFLQACQGIPWSSAFPAPSRPLNLIYFTTLHNTPLTRNFNHSGGGKWRPSPACRGRLRGWPATAHLAPSLREGSPYCKVQLTMCLTAQRHETRVCPT